MYFFFLLRNWIKKIWTEKPLGTLVLGLLLRRVIFPWATKFARIGGFLGTPVIWNTQKICRHKLSEPLFVFFRRDYSWQHIFWHNKWRLHPCLKMFVPSILPEIINDPADKLVLLRIYSNKQGVIHHIDRLHIEQTRK